MSSPRRVLIFARQFWLIASDASLRVQQLARSFLRRGCDVTVATPRWRKNWPEKFVWRDVSVQRTEAPQKSILGTGKYARCLSNWLQATKPFDLIYCDSCGSEAAAAIQTSEKLGHPSIVARFLPTEIETASDPRYAPDSTALRVLRTASFVHAPADAARARLLALGITNGRILKYPEQAGRRLNRDEGYQRGMRQALREINHDLIVKARQKVVLCPAEMNQQWQLDFLVQSLRQLIESDQSLRLWILGDGSLRSDLYEQLRYDGLQHLVVMPGVFSDPGDIMSIADLCLFPAAGIGHQWYIPTSIASGIPSIYATSSTSQNDPVQGHACSFPAGDASGLRRLVAGFLNNAQAWDAAGRRYAQLNQHASCPSDRLAGELLSVSEDLAKA